MAKITYIDAGGTARTIEAETGSTVMEAAIKNAIPGIEAECGGACACATCHVFVTPDWASKTGAVGEFEGAMLDVAEAERQPTSRLSCQIKMSPALDGLTLIVPA